MKNLAWTTDVHLDRLIDRDYIEYKEYLQQLQPGCLVISGDIADGDFAYRTLRDFDETFNFPIYFVLGNHDFYYRGFSAAESEIRIITENSRKLHWLTRSGVVQLNEATALIGIEGWGDAGNGTLNLSKGYSNDVLKIPDYHGLNRQGIGELMRSRGEHYSERLDPVLREAVENYPQVFLITHVPPFVEVCFDRSWRIIDEFRQPFYTCKAIGDLLLKVMKKNPKCNLTVLCGHTHEKADVKILENLRVMVKESGYGSWWEATLIDPHKF